MSEKLPYATQMLQETTELLRILRTQHADIERKDALLRQARLHVATSIAVNNNDSKAKNLYDAITKELQ